MSSGGGKAGGGSGGGGGGGFNPNAMFANQAIPGMYGGDPAAQPQFSDASVLTDPQTGMEMAMGGGSQDFSSFLPQGPNPNDVGGTQSDPNTPMPQFGSQAQAEGTSPNTGIAQLAKVLGQQQSRHEAPGPKGWEATPGAQTQPWGAVTPTAGQPTPSQQVANRFPGQTDLTNAPDRVPPSLNPALPEGVGTQPVPTPQPRPPQAPQPQPVAVEPSLPRRRPEEEIAPVASVAAAGGTSPPRDPISSFLDDVIRQVGGNYNIPEADRRNQQYGIGNLMQGVGRMLQAAGGRPLTPRARPQQAGQRSAYAPESQGPTTGSFMPQASIHWGGQPAAAGSGGTYNPQTFTRALWGVEGGAKTGSNVGKAQFGPEEIRKYGDPNDPRSVEREAVAIQNNLRPALGRNPEPWEMYLTHQQGMSGGRTLLTADPNMPAWEAIRRYYKSDAIAKKAITGNVYNELKGVPAENISVGQFRDWWRNRFNRELARVGGGMVAQSHPGTRTFTGRGATSTAYEGHVPTDEELNFAP